MSKVEIKKEDWDRIMQDASFGNFKLDLLKCLYSVFDQIQSSVEENELFSYTETRVNYDLEAGVKGDIMTEISFNHPTYGEVKITGKNLLGS